MLIARLAIWPKAGLMAFGLSFLAQPVTAAEAKADEIRAGLGAIQEKDQALQDIGWRLATANAEFCDKRQFSAGLQLLDLASFRDSGPIRAALGLSGDFMVQTAAAGSPADSAAMKPNAEILAIDGNALSERPSRGERDWQRLTQVHDEIDAALDKNRQITVTMANGDAIVLTGVPRCATRFELNDGGKRAVANGKRVQIGAQFPGFSYPQDEFAAAIAHELAHNVLGHRAWLDNVGRSRKNVRKTEREADRLMPWLLANAGYDPEAALRFMQEWGPRHSGGIFRKRTHEGWDERAEHIAAELEGMQQFWSGEGPADWKRHFVREISVE